MIIIGILLSIAGLGFFCWALFTLAVYALPFFAAVSAGMFVSDRAPVRSALSPPTRSPASLR